MIVGVIVSWYKPFGFWITSRYVSKLEAINAHNGKILVTRRQSSGRCISDRFEKILEIWNKIRYHYDNVIIKGCLDPFRWEVLWRPLHSSDYFLWDNTENKLILLCFKFEEHHQKYLLDSFISICKISLKCFTSWSKPTFNLLLVPTMNTTLMRADP